VSDNDIATGAEASGDEARPTGQPRSLDLTQTEQKGKQEEVREAELIVNSAGASPAELAKVETRESSTLRTDGYSPQDKARDDTRQTITLWLIGLLCAIVVLSFTALFMIGLRSKDGFDQSFFTNLKTLLDVLLGPVITLLSSAVGFYFGYQQATINATRPGGAGSAPGGTGPQGTK
jgi:hypothetical protein